MSKAISALSGATATGFVDVADVGLVGMVTIRGDLSDVGFCGLLMGALGIEVPKARKMADGPQGKLLWMSPDELLLVCPHSDADARVSAIAAALADIHHLAVNVSDARCVIDVTGDGPAIRDALAKLTPADLRSSSCPVGEVRRTRLAQVPAAIWFETEGRATVVCFRSVAGYVFGLLTNAAKSGTALGHF